MIVPSINEKSQTSQRRCKKKLRVCEKCFENIVIVQMYSFNSDRLKRV